MIDPAHVPDVAAEELLARYVLQGSHVRNSNQTVKPDAFIPHPYSDLSVTRHLQATADEIWAAGARWRRKWKRRFTVAPMFWPPHVSHSNLWSEQLRWTEIQTMRTFPIGRRKSRAKDAGHRNRRCRPVRSGS